MARDLSHRTALESKGKTQAWHLRKLAYFRRCLLKSQGHASCFRIAEWRTLLLEAYWLIEQLAFFEWSLEGSQQY